MIGVFLDAGSISIEPENEVGVQGGSSQGAMVIRSSHSSDTDEERETAGQTSQPAG